MSDRFRTLDRDSFDVVVVGAGLGGLAAAGVLARRGARVLIIDRHYVAGGNATIFKRRGYEFDVGLHYIGACSPKSAVPRVLRVPRGWTSRPRPRTARPSSQRAWS